MKIYILAIIVISALIPFSMMSLPTAQAANMTFTSDTSITANEVINSGETWTVDSGVTLTIVSSGSIDNLGGTINNFGTITFVGGIRNHGVINNEGELFITDEGFIFTDGTIDNGGFILTDGRLSNGGILNNNIGGVINNQNLGTFDNSDRGTIKNFNIIYNNGLFDNTGTITSGGTIHNFATLNNPGVINNSIGGEIDNSGTINNTNFIGNDGTIENFCGGTIIGNTPNGIAVINEKFPMCLSQISSNIKILQNFVFKSPPLKTKDALIHKLTEVQTMVDANNFHGAIEKLKHDIRAKMDGCFGGNPNNDWITNCNAQQELTRMIDGLISGLQALE